MRSFLPVFVYPLFLFSIASGQQTYLVTGILESGTVTIPDSTDTFTFNSEAAFALNAQYVSFTQNGVRDSEYGVWIGNLSTGTVKQLVKLGDLAGKSGVTFTDFGAYSVVTGNSTAGYWVVFSGETTAGDGLYSVPATGGSAGILADQSTLLPGVGGTGTYNFGYTPYAVPSGDSQHVVFTPYSPSAAFIDTLNGKSLGELAGANTPIEVANSNCAESNLYFQEPRIFGQNAIFMGGGSPFDWVNAALYLTTPSGIPLNGETCGPPNNFLVYAPLLDASTVLDPNFPDLRYGGNNGNSLQAIDNQSIYFTDGTQSALFSVSLASLGSIKPLLEPSTQLPNMPPPPYTINSLAAENGTAVFEASVVYNAGASAGIFATNGGQISRITGTGDVFFGNLTVGYGLALNPNAISNGRIAFGVYGGQAGLVLAKPATCAVDVTASVKAVFGPIQPTSTPGQQYQVVKVTNTSNQSVNGPITLAFYGLPSTVSLVSVQGSGVTKCTALVPLGSPYLTVSANALSPNGSVTTKVVYNNPNSLPISYTPKVFSGVNR